MVRLFAEQFGHFLTLVLAYALVLVGVILLLWFKNRLGWRIPAELGEVLEIFRSKDGRGSTRVINIELRGRTGAPIDLGHLISITMKNRLGGSFSCDEGFFRHCHLDSIRPGMEVDLIFGGLIKERVIVQVDLQRQILFVQSQFDQEQLVDHINHKAGVPA